MGIGVDAWDGIEMGIGIWDREYRDGDSDRVGMETGVGMGKKAMLVRISKFDYTM